MTQNSGAPIRTCPYRGKSPHPRGINLREAPLCHSKDAAAGYVRLRRQRAARRTRGSGQALHLGLLPDAGHARVPVYVPDVSPVPLGMADVGGQCTSFDSRRVQLVRNVRSAGDRHPAATPCASVRLVEMPADERSPVIRRTSRVAGGRRTAPGDRHHPSGRSSDRLELPGLPVVRCIAHLSQRPRAERPVRSSKDRCLALIRQRPVVH